MIIYWSTAQLDREIRITPAFYHGCCELAGGKILLDLGEGWDERCPVNNIDFYGETISPRFSSNTQPTRASVIISSLAQSPGRAIVLPLALASALAVGWC